MDSLSRSLDTLAYNLESVASGRNVLGDNPKRSAIKHVLTVPIAV